MNEDNHNLWVTESSPNQLRAIDHDNSGPFVIGGTSGSGTRVIAEILKQCNCFIGTNLNFANDNMDFGFCLTGRISWIKNKFPFDKDYDEVKKYLSFFKRLYFKEKLHLKDYYMIFKIGIQFFQKRNFQVVKTRPLKQRVENMLKILQSNQSEFSTNDFKKWGFKYTDSIFLLLPLLQYFPNMKFIHVIRDGRDMALSSNPKSFHNFASLFGIQEDDNPVNAFAFWAASNKWAYQLCQKEMSPKDYLLVRFEDVCNHPKEEIDRLLAFMELDSAPSDKVYEIPKKIASIGRWKQSAYLFADIDYAVLHLFGYV